MTAPNEKSLVLYRGRWAIVQQTADKKIAIVTPDGQQLSVRPKDVDLLHPGPAAGFSGHLAQPGDPLTAWELLQGGITTVAELAELAFGGYTPDTAWAAWQIVEEGVYFSGQPQQIHVHEPAKVRDIQTARRQKEAEETAWAAFVRRLDARSVTGEDDRYLAEIAAVALGQIESSRVLGRLGKPQTPEAAHELLLVTGYWTSAVNPYPNRLGVATVQPAGPAGDLPEEPRRDLTHLVALAIDDEGSLDPDDALSLEGDRLWVHIADVAALVSPDSAIDGEARERGANLYLPEGTIHMLPDDLTARLGLGLNEVSPALSFALTTGENGDVALLEIVPSWISVTRTTYEAAEGRLHESPFAEMLAIAERHLARRLASGAVEIDLPETRVRVGESGLVSVRRLLPLRSRLLVREAMLMAGEAVGQFGLTEGIPLIYTHQEISPLPADSTGGYAGMFATRKAMQRSYPRTDPGRHAGLGIENYVQVTSPLRRYLDLVAHQQLRAFLGGTPPLEATELGKRISRAGEAAGIIRAAERLSNQHWTLVYLQQNREWSGDGVVIEQKPGRETILIPDLAWETDIYHRHPRALNSTLHLTLDSVDLPARTARFKEN